MGTRPPLSCWSAVRALRLGVAAGVLALRKAVICGYVEDRIHFCFGGERVV